jgi:trimeric autotransporter adhesin
MLNMNHTSFAVTVFSVVVGILLFGVWSNVYVDAQQSSSSSTPMASLQSLPAGSSIATISPQLKAKICDPSNPSLKAVNTTESLICGIPKTIKSPALSSPAPSTSSSTAVSSTTPQQTTTTKPTAPAAAPKQQQQIATTNNNNTKAVSGTTGTKVATISPVGNTNNRSLPSALSPPPLPLPIVPQLNTVNQQQQPQQPQPQLLTTISNGTAGQNYTFSSNSPLLGSGKLVYLGYNGGSTGTSSTDSSSSDKSTTDTKSSHDSGSSTSKDKGRSDNNKSSGHKNDVSSSHTSSSDKKSSGHKNDSSKSSSSSKTTSKAKDHTHQDNNESNKGKKKASSKANSNHKGGDSFFDGDPFF